MRSVLTALAKAISQLPDPAVLRVLAKTALVTALVFIGMGCGLYWALIWIGTSFSVSTGGWVEAVAAALLALVMGWLLFRVLALAVLQLFADEIVVAVEARHYPDAAQRAKALPFHRDVANSLRSAGRALRFNALALPVAAALFFTAIGPAVVFLLVNAVLLGRELTDMAWLRHDDFAAGGQAAGHPVSGFERALLGGAIAVLMLVPFINLLAPIIGAAAGTHLTLAGLAQREEETRGLA